LADFRHPLGLTARRGFGVDIGPVEMIVRTFPKRRSAARNVRG
jgi:hypothetical protein